MLFNRIPFISFLLNRSVLLAIIGLGVNSFSYAADIALSMRAEKEVPVTIQGAVVPILKPVRKINVNDTILITIHYKNNETEDTYNINIDNPIPQGTHFVSGSGTGKNAIFLVSYDNGASYEEDIRIHNTPVTNVRWRFENMPAQAEGDLSFSLKVDNINAQLMR